MHILFLVAACASVAAVALICAFLFANSIPAFVEIGPLNFLLGTVWRPGNDLYGIFPMIMGSLYVTAGALLLGVPIALLTAIFLARFCPPRLYRLLKPAVNLLAGIPSVVYGFFGLVVLVPFVRNTFGGNGNSILTASVLLAMMILPTIIGVMRRRSAQCRRVTTRAASRWAPRTSAACSFRCSRRRSRASWRASS